MSDVEDVSVESEGMSTGKKVAIGLGICCIGILILAFIGGMMSPDKSSSSNATKTDTNSSGSDDGGVTLVLGGKSFKIYDYNDEITKNIKGNNTDVIDIPTEDGRNSYTLRKVSKDDTILNELDPKDNVTKITKDNITYQNILFYDGTPSVTAFKTKDGSIYEVVYYNGNDFLFDYQGFGKQMNQ